MYTNFQDHLRKELADIADAGLYKNERIIVSPQNAEIEVNTGQKVLNFCSYKTKLADPFVKVRFF